ncbi:hypothetical protein IFM89_026784 [Coptis chinensis]|uniref:MORF/ORRM1/DAG-like MORF domain-containing protein n=1 Tax=Coptis chinensis TaxID=261450 RepID=A0A835HQ13_9MAGN|nr:hypothetical protein IFM89_026784 [Coptis chinensis]
MQDLAKYLLTIYLEALLSNTIRVRFTAINLNHELEDIFSYQLLSEPNPEWNFDHWLIHIKLPPVGGYSTEQETLNLCIKMLARLLEGFLVEKVVNVVYHSMISKCICSQKIAHEEEAKDKIYIVWSKIPFGFAAEIDENTSEKLKEYLTGHCEACWMRLLMKTWCIIDDKSD